MGPKALLPFRRKACWGFFRPKNPTASAGFEPTNLVTIFLELHNTIYAAAVATVRLSGASIDGRKLNHIQNESQTPPWERRLKKQIDDLRKDVGRVQQTQNGNTSKRLQKHPQDTENKVNVCAKHDPDNVHIAEMLDTLKERLSVKSQRLRRCKEANGRKQQNRLFTTKEKNLLS